MSSSSMSRRVVSLLESRTVSFWVLGAWLAMTLVWVVPFQLAGQSPDTIRAIAEDWLVFRVLYVLVALTTLVCGWNRMSRDLRRVQRPGTVRPDPTAEAELVSGVDLDSVHGWLGSHGYAVARDGDALAAVKHRYSILGGSVFHLGIVLFGLSLMTHVLTVDTMSVRVTEGQTVGDAALAAGIPAVPSALRYLTLQSIQPEYHQDVLLFTRLDATMQTADGSARRFTLARPHWASATTIMSIGDYNLAPDLVVTYPDGSTQEFVVAMNLVPPGTEDTVTIPDVPFEVSMVAYPDHGVVDGRDVSLSYNIRNPKFLVAMQGTGRTGALVARKLVGFNEPVGAAGYAVSIAGLSRTGTFRITTAPALPFVALGLVAMTAGLAWRYLLRRQSVMAWSRSEGVLVDAWQDIGGRAAGRAMVVRALRDVGRAE